jgi:predicted metal-dependent phosphoesterase TrpH
MNKVDLHVHSIYSDDGQYSPEELAELCIKQGVTTLAITDHNTVEAIPEGIKAAQKCGITFIAAVELDCFFLDVNLHILGYNIDYHDIRFFKISEDIINQEKTASAKRLALVEALGIKLNHNLIKKLSPNNIITGEILAEAALSDQRNDHHELLLPYREGGFRSDNPYVNFYWDYCSQNKPAYVEIKYSSLSDTVDLIKSSGGIPILAHPGNNLEDGSPLLEGIIASKVEGIEVFSSYHSHSQIQYYLDYAQKRNLIVTCGSDFHGKTKPSIEIGSTSDDLVINSYLPKLMKNR